MWELVAGFCQCWGRPVIDEYKGKIEFVGLGDTNEGRVEYVKKELQLICPVYTDFDVMMKEIKPDILIVTSPDKVHHHHIVIKIYRSNFTNIFFP